MLRFIIRFSFCCLPFLVLPTLLAQTAPKPTLDWGPLIEGERRIHPDRLVASLDGQHAVLFELLKMRGNGPKYLMVFDDDMEMVRQQELVLGEKKELRSLLDIIQWEDQLFVFSEYTNKKDKKVYVFVESLNSKTYKANGDLKPVHSIDFEGYSNRNSGGFEVVWSIDSNKLMIYYDLPYDKDKPERFGFQVFKPGMELLWNSEVSLPYSDRRFEIVDYTLDEAGDVYILGRLYDSPQLRLERNISYEAHVLVFRQGADMPEEHTLDLEGNLPEDMAVSVTQRGDLVCAGFYAKPGENGIKGAFYLRVDRRSGEPVSSSIMPFSMELITLNQTERQERRIQKKQDAGGNVNEEDYTLDKIVTQSNGGSVLIGERFYTTVHTSGSGENQSTYVEYHYDDVILVSIDPAGKIKWAHKVPKASDSRNYRAPYASYALLIDGDYLYIVYNDDIRNADYDGTGKIKEMREGDEETVLVAASFDQNGPVGRETLAQVLDIGSVPSPRKFTRLPDGRVFMLGLDYPSYRAGTMSFP